MSMFYGDDKHSLDKYIRQKVINRRRIHHEAEVVIVGAGIFGCAIAHALGNQGRSVILLEKSLKEPDRIVGELLQPGGVQALKKLGLRDCLEDIDAICVYGYDVIYYGEEVRIPYPPNAREEEPGADKMKCSDEMRGTKRKRPEGRSFHHGRFVRKLREKVMENGNVSVVEATATDLVRSEYNGQVLGVEATIKGKEEGEGAQHTAFFGDLTIIADGYSSKFRKDFRQDLPVSKSKFYGLELIDTHLPMPQHGHVVLGEGAPILLYQIGTHETRILVDIPEDTPTASVKAGGVKAHLRNVVLPTLPASVQPSFLSALESGKLRSMPNSCFPPSTNRIPGAAILGDAMNMRHPLTGGGMTVAFNDAVLLSSLIDPSTIPYLDDTAAVQRAMSTFHWRRKNLTSTINILAQALYSLFAANDVQLKALQMGCFEYFKLGGNCIDGPVGLLAGIIRQPFVLFYHFFSVALYAMWIYITSGNPLLLPVRMLSSFGVFWKACVVIFPYIFAELRT
ncbi:squalene epoxidase [Polychaeton citri CBS 116435]|uniref:Squalene monooxygenase n=1 Tax=Polychaeton citri CBS 116435 TaxID=1314669 RepID=A0A9P4Q4D6_9PEZI|nr:squalene epoxidase [Polychaeton citri CBS 116435]